MKPLRFLLLTLLSGFAPSALAQDQGPGMCVDRPGLATPPCVLERASVVAEVGLAGWSRSSDAGTVSDQFDLGAMAFRLGLGGDTEFEAAITSLSSVRTRDRASGALSRNSGPGDLTLGLRHALGGTNAPIALAASITLPTGAQGIGAGGWGGQVMVPMAFNLPDGFGLSLTPELDLAPNSQETGHHFAWGGVVGLSHDLTPSLSLDGELGAWRDQDPAGATTDARAAFSLAWQVGGAWQIDAEADLGLTDSAPRQALMLGFAHQF